MLYQGKIIINGEYWLDDVIRDEKAYYLDDEIFVGWNVRARKPCLK